MSTLETDYLVIGAGTTGVAFADTIVAESDAHVTIVDRRAAPGGHWNDAYPFVRLHQPSSFYGVNSMELDLGELDRHGPNAGLGALASGPEVLAYFDRVLRQRLFPSGRVDYHPLSEYDGDGVIRSLATGERTSVSVRRREVHTSTLSPHIPLTHETPFEVAEGVELLPPNALPRRLAQDGRSPARIVVIGAGKTAMDTCLWLLGCGVDPGSITWVAPRDAWLMNREVTQTAPELIGRTIQGQVDLMETAAEATSADDWFLRLEQRGFMMRIDPTRTPAMCHLAVMAPGEVAEMRRIRDVVRLGRVQALEPDAMLLQGGRVPIEPGTLFVDCAAFAFPQWENLEPVFQQDRIVPQLLRAPFVCLSAALTAHVELTAAGDEEKNRLCTPVPFCNTPQDYVHLTAGNIANGAVWAEDSAVMTWMLGSRLDVVGRVMAQADLSDEAVQALLVRLVNSTPRAHDNLRELMADPRA